MNIPVIGVAFSDLKGFPFSTYDPLGTNKGNVIVTQGGVARNVAVDIGNLGANVKFALMLDEGGIGEEMRKTLTEKGIDLSYAVTVKEKGIGMWLAVFNEKGDLAGSISMMPEIAPLEKLIAEKGDELIMGADAVVVEFDTSENIARMVTEKCVSHGKPFYVIVGNMTVMLAMKPQLFESDCLIMNEIEAGKLFGRAFLGKTPEEALIELIAAGKENKLRRAVVTLGGDGSVYADFVAGEFGCVPAEPCRVVDTTGAGDAFFSACVVALTKGVSLKDAAKAGAHMAALVLPSKESECPKID